MFCKSWAVYSIISLLIVSSFFISCRDDNPVNPPNPVDYVVYFYDYQNDMCFALHTATLLIDSFALPVQPRGEITVSADGFKLYVPIIDNVSIIDLESKNVIEQIPHTMIREISVSPDGNLLALLGEELYILTTKNHTLLYSDSSGTPSDGIFSLDSKSFYCSFQYLAYRLSLDSGFTVVKKNLSSDSEQNIVWRITPSIMEKRWFVYLRYAEPYLYSFSVYDTLTDSIIFTDYLIPGEGNLAMTSDGKYVIYTNPGTGYSFEPEPPYEFKIFNTYTNEIEDVISTVLVFNKIDTVKFPVDEICITPDNKWLVGTSHDYNEIIIFNLKKREIEKQLSLGWNRYFSRPTCQLQLKE